MLTYTGESAFRLDRALYDAGRAAGLLVKAGAAPESTYSLSGRLYVSSSGWGLLSVPNALVRGLFDAMDEPGVELPPSGPDGRLNAHISVFTKDDIEKIGGPDALTERGHAFRYNIGPIKKVAPSGWGDMAVVYMVEVQSPALKRLRVSYGLSPLPHDDHQFHISVCVRRKTVLQQGGASKAAGVAPEPATLRAAVAGLPPLQPGYGQVYWNPMARSVRFVSGDGDDGPACERWKAALAAVPGVRSVAYDAEHLPDECGTLRAARPPWVKVADAKHIPTVAVDLDGTICAYDGWKGEDHFGAPRRGARAALREFQRLGYRVIVFTTRGATQKVKDYLHAQDIPFDYVNENPDQPAGSSGKVIADIFIQSVGSIDDQPLVSHTGQPYGYEHSASSTV